MTTDRVSPRAIEATGYVGTGARFLADDGTWKTPDGGGSTPGAVTPALGKMTRTSDQAITAVADTKVTWTTEVANDSSIVDLANSRFVAPVAGVYALAVFIAFSLTAGPSDARVFLQVNGVPPGPNEYLARRTTGAGHLNGATSLKLQAGDVLELYVRSDVTTAIRGTTPSWTTLALVGTDTSGPTGAISGGTP